MKNQRQSIYAIMFFILVALYLFPVAHADSGTYVVLTSPPPGAIVDEGGADGTWTFWQLPLWIQVAYVSGIVTGIIISMGVVVKLLPLLLVRVRSIRGNRNRDAINDYVKANPGSTVNEVARGTALNIGTVRYHVDRLALAGHIIFFRAGKFSRMFRNAGAYSDREIRVICASKSRTNRAIFSLLRDQPGLSNKEIAEQLKTSDINSHNYLSDLVKGGMVRFEMEDARKRYFLENDIGEIFARSA